MNKIYEAIGKIYFEAMHYRRDIGELKGDRK
jgi:phosphoribosylamine-glycine ligase